ncbi:MAG TPA: hypothetical protein PKH97_07980, partial [Tetrasphaera sp.]|nr:hypothetical protein [Tetrasphaera sp.]
MSAASQSSCALACERQWIDPGKSAQAAFDDREDFLAHDVFARTDVLSRMPVRLDCGTSDPFIAANRAFAAKLPTAKATFDKGAHTLDYQRRALGDHAENAVGAEVG